MPSCAILYYSNTGNTKLACEYIVNRIPQVDFDLFDMRDLSNFDPDAYTFIGFATYTDFQAPPRFFADAVSRVRHVEGKETFLLVTYAGTPGKTLKGIKDLVEKRGFRVVAGHGISMPENYSPNRKKGSRGDDNPKEKELESFRQFIRELGDLIVTKELKGQVEAGKIRIGFINSFIPMKIRTDRSKGMGKKYVNVGLCTGCGYCMENCAYGAIHMENGPVFDENKCHACFACYNLCPVGAITCEKLRSASYRYPGPSEDLKKRMSY